MLVPYSTDAPIYHWPIATVSLIVANIVLFFGLLSGSFGPWDNWMLQYGNGLHPDQWFRAMFTHAGVEHLVGNMLFLWVFGLVVEGKLGWWKFLCCYVGIGATQSMLEQAVMLGYSGEVPGSVGASAAIFGLMAMATVWAPMNEISFAWIIYYFWAHTIEISIAVLAAVYTGIELLMLTLTGGAGGSSWLHLAGFALGFPLGVVLLKRGVVDCEGWDLFHVWSGDYGSFKKEPEPAEVFAKVEERRQRRDQHLLADARKQFQAFLKDGNADAALKLYEKMKGVGGGFTLEGDELVAVIQTMHAAKRWRASAPYMAEFIARFSERADAMRIKLAQICVVELGRPGKALDLLAEVDATLLPQQHAQLVTCIMAKAHAMQEEGIVELEVETW